MNAYLEFKPINYYKIIVGLGQYLFPYKRILFSYPVREFFNDKESIDTIIKLVREDTDDQHFLTILSGIHRLVINSILSKRHNGDIPDSSLISQEDMTKLIKKMDGIKRLALIIENEDDIENINFYLEGLYLTFTDEFYKEFMRELNFIKIKSKLLKPKVPLNDAVYLLSQLYGMDNTLMDDIKDIISFRVKTGINLDEFSSVCVFLNDIHESFPEDLLKYFIDLNDLNEIVSKFEQEENLLHISWCFPHIKEFVLSNKNRMNHIANILGSKINEETNLFRTTELLTRIAYLGNEFSDLVIKYLDKTLLKERILEIDIMKFLKRIILPYDDFTEIKEKKETAINIIKKLELWDLLNNEDMESIKNLLI
jgi:hypothetical protein